ncbi:hypothetical protein MTO96_017625 [Rhipicephalus appendiculatus]
MATFGPALLCIMAAFLLQRYMTPAALRLRVPPLPLVALTPPLRRHHRFARERAFAAARRSTGPTPPPAPPGAVLVRGAGNAGISQEFADELGIRLLLVRNYTEQPIRTSGYFNAPVSYNDKCVSVRFFVTDNGASLLGLDAIQALKVASLIANMQSEAAAHDPTFGGQAQYGQTPYAPEPNAQAPYGQAPYEQAPYGQWPYGQWPYGQQKEYDYVPGAEGHSTWTTVTMVCTAALIVLGILLGLLAFTGNTVDRQPLVCTLGWHFDLVEQFPPDGICDYIFYDSMYRFGWWNQPLNESSYLRGLKNFLHHQPGYRNTTLGLGFSFE